MKFFDDVIQVQYNYKYSHKYTTYMYLVYSSPKLYTSHNQIIILIVYF